MNTPRIAIIDYELGNVRSVANALEAIGASVEITRNPERLHQAHGLILPGVGAFAEGMEKLRHLGLVELLNTLVLEEKKPILGICLGMQLMAALGKEGGAHAGLGWIDAVVDRLPVSVSGLKIPHVGWNDVSFTQPSIFGTAGEVKSYYFVHSYHVTCRNPDWVLGTCDYGTPFHALLGQGNIFAAQFHPEKSQTHGLALLRAFAQHAMESTCREAVC